MKDLLYSSSVTGITKAAADLARTSVFGHREAVGAARTGESREKQSHRFYALFFCPSDYSAQPPF